MSVLRPGPVENGRITPPNEAHQRATGQPQDAPLTDEDYPARLQEGGAEWAFYRPPVDFRFELTNFSN
jgi:hypothetical protein